MTFVSIVTIAVTLFFLGCVVVLFLNVKLWLHEVSAQASVAVFLQDSLYLDSAGRQDLVGRIVMMPQVKSVALVGKDDAWDRFAEIYGTDMLDAIDENPLPARLDIALDQKYPYEDAVRALRREIGHVQGIEGIRYHQEWLIALRKFRRALLWIAVFLVPVLALALYFMIANTIKLTIYARRDLITNMHFVGATELYIKTPFILEGILQGVIGGGLGIAGLLLLKLFLARFSLYWGQGAHVFLGVLGIGVFFGWVGSVGAVRKFLV